MLTFDHLVLVAPSLELGASFVEARLGVSPQPGGHHRELGTHNLLLRIGSDCFLEVIAINPAAHSHCGPRVFGMHDAETVAQSWQAGKHLHTWVGRTCNLSSLVAAHEPLIGPLKAVSRGERHWHMAIPADGSLPLEGAIPTPVQYEPDMIPAHHMIDFGLELIQVVVTHPQPQLLTHQYFQMDVQGPLVIENGPRFNLKAFINTPQGMRELT
ncbi:MAG: VOC family protein [Blastocatellia bacterium]|nr:VOC family protein [Blastocatellia bacterium]